MVQASSLIRIPLRRHEQLKLLAQKLGLSLADTVAHMLKEQVAAGVLPAGVPGIEVKADAGSVILTVDENQPVRFTREVARQMAEGLRAVADFSLLNAQKLGRSAGIPWEFRPSDNYTIARQGAGIRFGAPFGGKAVMLTADLARDLADQIEDAAG